jgi:hypothetical protein
MAASSRQTVCVGVRVCEGFRLGVRDGVSGITVSVGILISWVIVDLGCGMDWADSTSMVV